MWGIAPRRGESPAPGDRQEDPRAVRTPPFHRLRRPEGRPPPWGNSPRPPPRPPRQLPRRRAERGDGRFDGGAAGTMPSPMLARSAPVTVTRIRCRSMSSAGATAPEARGDGHGEADRVRQSDRSGGAYRPDLGLHRRPVKPLNSICNNTLYHIVRSGGNPAVLFAAGNGPSGGARRQIVAPAERTPVVGFERSIGARRRRRGQTDTDVQGMSTHR